MLTLHNNHHFGLPHANHSTHRLELSPVTAERDELIEAIDTANDAGMIKLENTPDVEGLEQFWTGVQEDLHKDPDWFNFAED